MEDLTMNKRKESSPCSSSGLGIHKDSQLISKAKPKIRIIHIFAPEIIKTDVQNFRELVQSLTGKPSPAEHHRRLTNKSSRKQKEQQMSSDTNDKKAEERVQIHQVKEEEEMWNNNNTGGFLSSFSDLDGFNFIQQFDDFSVIPSSNRFHAFEETQLA